MTERKFNIPLIIMAAAAFLLGLFALPAESIVLAVITIVICVIKRRQYLVKIPLIISIIAIAGSGAFLALLIYHGSQGFGTTSYWLMQLLFG